METENKILEGFITKHPDEALLVIEKFGVEELIEFLGSLPIDLSSLLLSKLNRLKAASCIEKADKTFVTEILESSSPSISANILRVLDRKLIRTILDGVSSEQSGAIMKIIDFPEHSAGAYMNPRVFTLKENMSIGQALELIRENNIYVQSHIFILSSKQILVGSIELKNLVSGDPSKSVRSIMKSDQPVILANINIHTLIEKKMEYEELPILPIVDIDRVFLGIIDQKSLSVLKFKKEFKRNDFQQASIALGDLYQIGLSGLLRSTSELFWNDKSK